MSGSFTINDKADFVQPGLVSSAEVKDLAAEVIDLVQRSPQDAVSMATQLSEFQVRGLVYC
jgi:hypothetical protein